MKKKYRNDRNSEKIISSCRKLRNLQRIQNLRASHLVLGSLREGRPVLSLSAESRLGTTSLLTNSKMKKGCFSESETKQDWLSLASETRQKSAFGGLEEKRICRRDAKYLIITSRDSALKRDFSLWRWLVPYESLESFFTSKYLMPWKFLLSGFSWSSLLTSCSRLNVRFFDLRLSQIKEMNRLKYIWHALVYHSWKFLKILQSRKKDLVQNNTF